MKTILLRVSSPYLCAGAVFTRLAEGWSCTHAAPILRWMIGMPPFKIKQAIAQRKDWSYHWIKTIPHY